MLKIDNVKIYDDLDENQLKDFVIKKYKINKNDVISFKIYKKSIDARDKSDVHFVYSFILDVKNDDRYIKYAFNDDNYTYDIKLKRKSKYRPVIIGAGPAGLFCALRFIEFGIKPIILERGKKVEERIKDVEKYFETGIVNEESNVQFGEGGAGTFSDGKLNTGVNGKYNRKVLETFVKFGAPKEILYINKPHIGTDNLVNIVKNIREYIIENGGEILFNSKFTDFKTNEGKLISVIYNGNIEIETDTCILAIGHSARDVFELLKEKNVEMEIKNFSVGVRIEHPQKLINVSQYGDITKLKLPPAEYKLVYHGKERDCYSFCMCPGGRVVASSSEKDGIVTNGMSNFKRNLDNANSALLVNITKNDFKSGDVLEGVKFQRDLEKKAYILGGENGNAPIQLVKDFLNGNLSKTFGEVKHTYKPGVKFANLNDLFPDFILNTLKEAIKYFGTKIEGFDMDSALLTAVETRSSSPVRILRKSENFMSNSIYGLFPCSEGAGYAGGIMSAAIDGINVANAIILNK